MPKDSGATPKRVLLTSNLPKPTVSPLATLMHDARNKLTPIMAGFAERRDRIGESNFDFEALTMLLDEIRDRSQDILRGARAGIVDFDRLPQYLNRMRRQMILVSSAVQSVKGGDYCVPANSILEAAEEFDALLENGIQNIESRATEVKPEYGNITKFVYGIVQDYERQYPHVRFNFDADVDIHTSFCPASIKRTLENLLNNAIQALPETNGQITIRLNEMYYGSEERPFAEIEEGIYDILEVSDNGSGIPEDILDRLPNSSVTTKKHGSGTGLVSARESILQHHGHLFVESREGQGSKVTALLPSKFPPPAPLPRIRRQG